MTIDVNDETLALPNVQAFLRMIRVGEGTSDDLGYQRVVGSRSGAQFDSFADHPRRIIQLSPTLKSSAAGAYQFLIGTWDWLVSKYNLPDFTPHSQDLGAVGLIKRRGALIDVVEGRFSDAVNKVNKEWASLPNSPYGQRTVTMADAQNHYVEYGGTLVA